ncbi:MAG: hypothetical protein HGA67_00695 [Candidatus Yonathbacteria bacterium]|nr:hypothetical protein [Candidatus Yonathbacteria bacterium]
MESSVLLALVGGLPTIISFILRWPIQTAVTLSLALGVYSVEPVHTVVDRTTRNIDAAGRYGVDWIVETSFSSLRLIAEGLPEAPLRLQEHRHARLVKQPPQLEVRGGALAAERFVK